MPHVRPARANVGNFVFQMPKNLKRYYGKSDLHFITFSCFRRFALLGDSAEDRHVGRSDASRAIAPGPSARQAGLLGKCQGMRRDSPSATVVW